MPSSIGVVRLYIRLSVPLGYLKATESCLEYLLTGLASSTGALGVVLADNWERSKICTRQVALSVRGYKGRCVARNSFQVPNTHYNGSFSHPIVK